jgi:hypothetical protein
MTEPEWRQTMERINSDPATAELRIELERACWRYLNRLRENGVSAALRVVVARPPPTSNKNRRAPLEGHGEEPETQVGAQG